MRSARFARAPAFRDTCALHAQRQRLPWRARMARGSPASRRLRAAWRVRVRAREICRGAVPRNRKHCTWPTLLLAQISYTFGGARYLWLSAWRALSSIARRRVIAESNTCSARLPWSGLTVPDLPIGSVGRGRIAVAGSRRALSGAGAHGACVLVGPRSLGFVHSLKCAMLLPRALPSPRFISRSSWHVRSGLAPPRTLFLLSPRSCRAPTFSASAPSSGSRPVRQFRGRGW
jgi:hypothetical protein